MQVTQLAEGSFKQHVTRLVRLLKIFVLLLNLLTMSLLGVLALSTGGIAFSLKDELGRAVLLGSFSDTCANRIDQSEKALQVVVKAKDDFASNTKEIVIIAPESVFALLDSASDSHDITTFGGFSLSQQGLRQLQNAVSVVESQDYDVGFIMVDITTGQGVAYNPDELFYCASTIKAPFIVSLAAYSPFSVELWEESMEAAITYSSNEDYEYLYYAFGSEYLSAWYDEAGVSPLISEEFYTYYTSRELAKLWLRNYLFFMSDEPYCSLVQSWFAASENSIIFDTLGSHYYMNTKAGWIDDYYEDYYAAADAGIVWAFDRPYLVVIMSDSPADMQALELLVIALDDAHKEML